MSQVIDGVVIPYPIEIWKDGVYRPKSDDGVQASIHEIPHGHVRGNRDRITLYPIWIALIAMLIDTKEPLVLLRWTAVDGSDVRHERWVERATIGDSRLLISGLAGSTAPVTSENARDLVAAFAAMEMGAAVAHPPMLAARRIGMHVIPEGIGWLIGRHWIGPGHVAPNPQSGEGIYTDHFDAHGEPLIWELQWQKIRAVGTSVARFVIGATFAAPLISLLNGRTFVLHHVAQARSGKSGLCKFAAAAWGDPESSPLFETLNRTEISVTEVFRKMNNLPLVYDEWEVATITPKQFIYSVCSEVGRSRGAKGGGIRAEAIKWKTLVRTTGERPLISGTALEGQPTRVLQIEGAGVEEGLAKELHNFKSWGHYGRVFLERLAQVVNEEGGMEKLRARFATIRGLVAEGAAPGLGPQIEYASIIALGQTLATRWILDVPMETALAEAVADAKHVLMVAAATETGSYAERALNFLRGHLNSNPMVYDNPEGLDADRRLSIVVGTVHKDHGMIYTPAMIDPILTRNGYHPIRVWRDFATLGWTTCEPRRLTTRHKLHMKVRDYYYVIKRHIFHADTEKERDVVARRAMMHVIQPDAKDNPNGQ